MPCFSLVTTLNLYIRKPGNLCLYQVSMMLQLSLVCVNMEVRFLKLCMWVHVYVYVIGGWGSARKDHVQNRTQLNNRYHYSELYSHIQRYRWFSLSRCLLQLSSDINQLINGWLIVMGSVRDSGWWHGLDSQGGLSWGICIRTEL